jgi:hypothetical protein
LKPDTNKGNLKVNEFKNTVGFQEFLALNFLMHHSSSEQTLTNEMTLVFMTPTPNKNKYKAFVTHYR